MKIKVSVISTLFNYREYISECIESFLKQDFICSELIIVDDASTDNPFEEIRPFLCERVRYIRLPENRNYSNAKNMGIRSAKSEILVMLDADDMLTENGISLRYKKLMEGYDLVHGPCLRLERNKKLVRDPMWPKWIETKNALWIHAQGVMLRKEIHRKIGLYDPWFWAQGDREMFLRIANADFKVGTVDEDVAIYRIHGKQMHRSKRKRKDRENLNRRMHEVLEKRKGGDFSGLEMCE